MANERAADTDGTENKVKRWAITGVAILAVTALLGSGLMAFDSPGNTAKSHGEALAAESSEDAHRTDGLAGIDESLRDGAYFDDVEFAWPHPWFFTRKCWVCRAPGWWPRGELA